MQDGIINGTGNSRYLKSAITEATTFEELKAMLIAGTLPIDLNGINAAGWQQIGTALSKANLLSDTTSTLLGGVETVDEGLVAVSNKIGEILTFSSERDDLGEDYLLCDGSYVDTVNDYPDLADYLKTHIRWEQGNKNDALISGSVVFANNMFVSASASYSFDGENWHLGTYPDGILGVGGNQIAYGDGKFIICANSNYLYYSTNGIDWNLINNLPNFGSSDYRLWSVAYGNGIWVVCGDKSYSYANSFYSYDGINWSASSYTTGARRLKYLNGYFFATANGSKNPVYISPDGISWSSAFPMYASGAYYVGDFAYGDGKWVITTKGYYDRIYTSTDTTNWTYIDNPTAGDADMISYINSKWYMSTGYLSYSDDLVSWTPITAIPGNTYSLCTCQSICFESGMWTYYGYTGYVGYLFYSLDGINWGSVDGIDFGATDTMRGLISGGGAFTIWGVDNSLPYYLKTYEKQLPVLLDAENQVYGYIRALDGTEGD